MSRHINCESFIKTNWAVFEIFAAKVFARRRHYTKACNSTRRVSRIYRFKAAVFPLSSAWQQADASRWYNHAVGRGAYWHGVICQTKAAQPKSIPSILSSCAVLTDEFFRILKWNNFFVYEDISIILTAFDAAQWPLDNDVTVFLIMCCVWTPNWKNWGPRRVGTEKIFFLRTSKIKLCFWSSICKRTSV